MYIKRLTGTISVSNSAIANVRRRENRSEYERERKKKEAGALSEIDFTTFFFFFRNEWEGARNILASPIKKGIGGKEKKNTKKRFHLNREIYFPSYDASCNLQAFLYRSCPG